MNVPRLDHWPYFFVEAGTGYTMSPSTLFSFDQMLQQNCTAYKTNAYSKKAFQTIEDLLEFCSTLWDYSEIVCYAGKRR